MDIEPLSKETRVQSIIGKVKDLLLRGVFFPGSKLPTEVDLIKTLGVSRTPIREAIKVLQAIGVLEIRRGDGTYINTSITPNAIQPLIFNLILQRGTPVELAELRLFFEEAYTKLAASKRTPEDLDALGKCLREMEILIKSQRHDEESLLKKDLEFHFTVLKATHNKLVYEIGQVIMELFTTTIRTAHRTNGFSPHALEHHRRIYDCIQKQDLSKIEPVVRESLRFWETLVSDGSINRL
jgi:GntR family transcriptional repressor for pyruvate dehydrogenase complex